MRTFTFQPSRCSISASRCAWRSSSRSNSRACGLAEKASSRVSLNLEGVNIGKQAIQDRVNGRVAVQLGEL